MIQKMLLLTFSFLLSLMISNAIASEFALRGEILHFLDNPIKGGKKGLAYFEDGILVIEDGRIKQVMTYQDFKPKKKMKILDRRGKLILPGFIDTHIHFPQTDMIASYGEQLLDWLNKYTFPTEKKFSDPKYAKEVAIFFIQELLKNGTTTALVFSTIHPESVEALFNEAYKFNMRLISGKTLMDRNAPQYLLDTPQSAYDDSKKLIKKWHNHSRLLYAITPRFAPTSTPEQLKVAGDLLKEFPGVYLHTHLSENKKEIQWVLELFPKAKNYLDVYHTYSLVKDHSLFAHSIHLEEDEIQLLARQKSAVAFCPTSNLFLGSGLFDYEKMKAHSIPVGIGTDIGAGTSFSILKTLQEAYKISQMKGNKLSSLESFYLATLGGARALKLEDKIGNFEEGKEADFIIIHWEATPLMKRRLSQTQDLSEKLFVLLTLGDDRNIFETYVMGKKVFPFQ